MKTQELINLINDHEGLYSLLEAENIIPTDIELVAEGLESDARRWFETATDIYKCEDGFVGINGVKRIYSEMMSSSDCDITCTALEYQAVPSITYKPKN